MSGVTASRGEMMQVTPDVARDQGEFFFYLLFCKKVIPLQVLKKQIMIM